MDLTHADSDKSDNSSNMFLINSIKKFNEKESNSDRNENNYENLV